MPSVLIFDTQTHSKPRVRRMLEEVSRAIHRTIDAPYSTIRVRYEGGKPANFWEGESGEVPTQQLKVFVRVTLLEGRPGEKLHALFGEISAAVAGALNILPESVWTHLDEVRPDRVAWGAESLADRRREKK